MLYQLSIRDVVLVDKLDMDFSDGLGVLTGETGAGKSILLDALNLALGGRADSNLVRSPAENLTVSAVFELDSDHPSIALVSEQDLANDEGTLVLRRTVGRDGRSRAFVNDQPVSVRFLRKIGATLVEIHGQFDTHGLMDSASHLTALDAYRRAAKGDKADRDCAEAWQTWSAATTGLREAEAVLADALREEDFLRHNVAELDRLAPQPDEEQALSDRRAIMRHGEQIMTAVNDARAGLESADVEGALRTAAGRLSKAASQAAGRLDAVIATVDRAAIEAGEAINQLDHALSDFDADPAELEHTEERLFALKAAARKFSCTVAELPDIATKMQDRLAALDGGSTRVQELSAAAKIARDAYERTARTLSTARAKAAKTLDDLVNTELAPLRLHKATFRTLIVPKSESGWSATGVDQVTFEVSTNPGMPPGPLSKIASGGELARFMLALKVVLAGTQSRSTLIFDEVDAGIGGATANAVGERLARLAKSVQVLVVTHAPQVAARGGAHWRVSKSSRGQQTTTNVELLDAKARREEIARMLAGEKVTAEARAAAESLIAGNV